MSAIAFLIVYNTLFTNPSVAGEGMDDYYQEIIDENKIQPGFESTRKFTCRTKNMVGFNWVNGKWSSPRDFKPELIGLEKMDLRKAAESNDVPCMMTMHEKDSEFSEYETIYLNRCYVKLIDKKPSGIMQCQEYYKAGSLLSLTCERAMASFTKISINPVSKDFVASSTDNVTAEPENNFQSSMYIAHGKCR